MFEGGPQKLNNPVELIRKPEDRIIKKLYHGSSEAIEKFDPEKIGSNIGAGAEGWGFYFTTSKKLTKTYGDFLNEVEIDLGKTDNSFLVWEKKLPPEQQKLILDNLDEEARKRMNEIGYLMGEQVYWILANFLGGPRGTSEFLFRIGIDGVKNEEIITIFDESLIKKVNGKEIIN